MTGPDSRSPPAVGTKLGGQYSLHRFLGAGGEGAVYEAITDDDSRVAVKILLHLHRGDAAADTLARFAREARVSAAIDSPYVVPVTDASTDADSGFPYIVMPLLSGLDLMELLICDKPLHPTVAVRIAYQVALALDAAHNRGIIHRDIKPANIFLDHALDGTVTARVLDFGVAKSSLSQDGLTKTGAILGTPQYMSPEQIVDGKHVAPQADVWSLGLVLYNMLTAEAPFVDIVNYTELVAAVRNTDVPHLQDVAPWIDPGLATVTHGALIRTLADRCPSAGAFAEALHPYLDGEPQITGSMLRKVDGSITETNAERATLSLQWDPQQPTIPAPRLEEEEPDPLLGQSLGGRYTVLRQIGSGGMGAVYEAEGSDGERYAVKVINPDLAGRSAAAVRRFVREARTTMRIDNPHVVRVFDADTDPDEGLPYIVMELMRGEDLNDLISEHGALEPEIIARLFVHACRGLAAAHAVGVVHRDIKPANLFLHESPHSSIELKICDFGIAKWIEGAGREITSELTETGCVIGSPEYMSPEQTKGAKRLDARSDVWSLGIVLYKALAGTTPWEDYQTVGEILVAICTEGLPHLQDKAPWVPCELAEVVHKALARTPDSRFQSMEEFAAALEPFAATTIRRRDIRPVSEHDRERVESRASMPEPPLSSVTRITDAQKPRPTSSRGSHLVVGALMVALAALTLVVLLRGEDSEHASPVPEAPASSQPAPTSAPTPPMPAAKHQVTVTIAPRRATVTVDGRVEDHVDGRLVLTGEPGAAFQIVVAADDRKLEQAVVITKDGKASPSLLTLAAPAMPSAPKPLRPVGAATSRPHPAKPPPAPPPAAKPAPASKPAGDKVHAVDDWR